MSSITKLQQYYQSLGKKQGDGQLITSYEALVVVKMLCDSKVVQDINIISKEHKEAVEDILVLICNSIRKWCYMKPDNNELKMAYQKLLLIYNLQDKVALKI